MKKDIHPSYQEVLFVDTATGARFVCGSTLQPKERESYEGKEYPVYRVPISSASHPFFTGSQTFVSVEGRVDKFKKRYARQSPPPFEKQAEKGQDEKPDSKKIVKKAKSKAKK